VLELLELVGIPNAKERLRGFAHQLSGGMRQRVMIAIALALHPKLIIADEPTTALDVTIQAQILELIQRVANETGAAVMLITHDLGVVAGMTQRIQVMYAGRIVEDQPSRDLLTGPHHPYTEALLSAIPAIETDNALGIAPRERIVLEGEVPSPINPPAGCRFHPRCAYATEICRTERPELTRHGNGRFAACHHPLDEQGA